MKRILRERLPAGSNILRGTLMTSKFQLSKSLNAVMAVVL